MTSSNSKTTTTPDAACPDWCGLGPHGPVDTAGMDVRVLASARRSGYVRIVVPAFGHVFDEKMAPAAALSYAEQVEAGGGWENAYIACSIRQGVSYATSRRARLAARMRMPSLGGQPSR